MHLPWGMFGENFTTAGLFEAELNIGDKFRIGAAEVMVTEPRMPCYKLGIKFGRTDIIKKFLLSELTGFYFAVLQEGQLSAGDQFDLIEKNKTERKGQRYNAPIYTRQAQHGVLRRAIGVEALPEGWRSYFQEKT